MSAPKQNPGRSLGHRAPVLWLVVPFMIGLGVGKSGCVAPVAPLLGTAFVATVCALTRSTRNPVASSTLLVVAMALGGWASYIINRPGAGDWLRLPAREAELTVRIDRTFASSDARKFSGLGQITAIDTFQELVGQRVYVSASLRKGDAAPIRSAVVRLRGVLLALAPNPPSDTFEGFLANAGINFELSRAIFLDRSHDVSAYARFREDAAIRFGEILGAGVEGKRPELVGIYRAMLMGRQNELTDEQEGIFRQSGTMHVFSISGLHIAVIAVGLHALLSLLRLGVLMRAAAGLTALWLYVDITGATPSAVRAFVMIAVIQSAMIFRVARNPIAALSASALVVLVVDPLQMFSASFQMSYGIVAGLLLMGLPLAERWQERGALFRSLPKATWGTPRRLIDWVWREILSAAALGVPASLVGAVTGITFFKLFTPGAFMANLWLIPAAGFVLIVGLISLLCGLVGFESGSILANHAAILLLWGMENGIRQVARLPGMWCVAGFDAPWIGVGALALLLTSIACGYIKNWAGWCRGFWMPFAVVAVVFCLGTTFG